MAAFTFQDIVYMMMLLSYIIMCPIIVKRITDEKVAKAKEMLRMMGLSDWVFWGSHFLNYFLIFLVHSIIYSIIYFLGFGGLPSFMYTDPTLFFVAMILYSASTIMSCMLLTTVFNRPIIAVVASVILYYASYSAPANFLSVTYSANLDIGATQPGRILSCLLPNMGLYWVISLMGQCEAYGYGATWGNLFSTVSFYEDFTIGLAMVMMLVSCFFYGINKI